MSSQNNHRDISLIGNIIIRNTTHQLTFRKVRAHTKIFGNDEDNKLAKCGIQEDHILVTPFDLIGHIIPYGPPKPLHPPTMMAPLITSYATLKKEHLSAHNSSGENLFPNISKWITDIDIHPQLSNLLWDSKFTSKAQIAQTIKFCYNIFIGNYHKYKLFDSNLSTFNTYVASPKTTIVSTYHLVVLVKILLM